MGERLLVTYHFSSTPAQAAARALGIALEQSTELPAGAEPERVHALGLPGRVEELSPLDGQPGAYAARISFPLELVEAGGITALATVLFGNTSMQADVTLAGAELPAALLAGYAGPSFGSAGLRAKLGAALGPLTCTALKPVGVGVDELAALAGRFARAGIHLIKDDHGFLDQAYAPFAERVAACQAAVVAASAQAGERSLYVPHISGGLDAMRCRVDLCLALGIEAVMVAPMVVGLPAFEAIAGEAAAAGLLLLAHPALSGATRMAPDFLLGRVFRLLGADAVIFVNHGGRFGTPPATCAALADNLRSEWGALKRALPVPAGGMTPARVGEMVRFYGAEVVLLVSGALYPADAALDERARAFVQAARTAPVQQASALEGTRTA